MLIATFGVSTAWVGKTITFENEEFVLEEHGPVVPSAIVEYDKQGHLEWSSDGLRKWVYELAADLTPSPPPPEENGPADTPTASSTTTGERAEKAPRAKAKSVYAPDAKPMLIATFRDGTVRAASTIIHDRGAFIVEGEGLRTAADVMEYDRRGQLVWADEGSRAWVGAKATRTVSDPVALRLLDKARHQYESGDIKAAGKTLWSLNSRGSAGGDEAARGTIALATEIRRHADESLAVQVDSVIDRAARFCGWGWVPSDPKPADSGPAATTPASLFVTAVDPQPAPSVAEDIAPVPSSIAEAGTRERLETARQQHEQGEYEAAVETLWLLDAEARKGDKEAAQGVIDLATEVGSCVDGNLGAECADLVLRSREALVPRPPSPKKKPTSTRTPRGTVGFWLVITGFFVPIVGVVGFAMCCAALISAKIDDTDPGMAWLGAIIGGAVFALNVILFFVLFVGR